LSIPIVQGSNPQGGDADIKLSVCSSRNTVSAPDCTTVCPDCSSTCCPPKTAKATSVKVNFIGDVERGTGTIYSVAPTKQQAVGVSFTPSNATVAGQITFDILNSGGNNGTATVTANATLSGTNYVVTVTGGTQTAVGSAGNLKIRAKCGTTELKQSSGFSVCAQPSVVTTAVQTPTNQYQTVYNFNYQGVLYMGMIHSLTLTSDSGTLLDLDKISVSELNKEVQRNNPPFTAGGIVALGYDLASNYPKSDLHGAAQVTLVCGPVGTFTVDQLFEFKCERCGAVDIAVPQSGFRLVHQVFQGNTPAEWGYKVTKSAVGVTIGTLTTGAGAGTILPNTCANIQIICP
jgi:hypothetical protein